MRLWRSWADFATQRPMTPFRIYSGFDRRQAEAAEVFSYSVRAHASIPVEITFLRLADLPISRSGTTEFSYGRFCIPHLCDFQGVALFADGCDQLCLGDIAELASLPMAGHLVRVCKHRVPRQDRPRVWTSVMLMDCAALNWWTPEFVEEASDERLMRLRDLSDAEIGDLPDTWNWLMEYGPREDARLLHWSHLSNPEGGSWIQRSGSGVWREWRDRWRAEG